MDPNDKIGPAGSGEARNVDADDPQNRVFFGSWSWGALLRPLVHPAFEDTALAAPIADLQQAIEAVVGALARSDEGHNPDELQDLPRFLHAAADAEQVVWIA